MARHGHSKSSATTSTSISSRPGAGAQYSHRSNENTPLLTSSTQSPQRVAVSIPPVPPREAISTGLQDTTQTLLTLLSPVSSTTGSIVVSRPSTPGSGPFSNEVREETLSLFGKTYSAEVRNFLRGCKFGDIAALEWAVESALRGKLDQSHLSEEKSDNGGVPGEASSDISPQSASSGISIPDVEAMKSDKQERADCEHTNTYAWEKGDERVDGREEYCETKASISFRESQDIEEKRTGSGNTYGKGLPIEGESKSNGRHSDNTPTEEKKSSVSSDGNGSRHVSQESYESANSSPTAAAAVAARFPRLIGKASIFSTGGLVSPNHSNGAASIYESSSPTTSRLTPAVRLKLLLCARGVDTLSGLQSASYFNQIEALIYVLRLIDQYFFSATERAYMIDHRAPTSGKGAATALMLVSSLSACRLLLDAGADPHLSDSIGMTALHYAASADNVAVVAALIHRGADINARDQRLATPLHWAVFEGFHYTAMMLIAKGADQSLQDAQGQTPLMLACTLGDWFLVKQLVLEGAPIDLRDSLGRDCVAIAEATGSKTTLKALKNGRSDHWVSELSRKGFTVTFFWVAFWTGAIVWILFVIPVCPLTNGVFNVSTMQLLALVLSAAVSLTYAHTWLRDPGYVPIGDDATFEELLATDTLPLPCPTCQTHKSLRSKHCHSCGRCVYRFDHHCPWTNNCVGLYNHHWFYFFCLLFVVEMMIIASSTTYTLFHSTHAIISSHTESSTADSGEAMMRGLPPLDVVESQIQNFCGVGCYRVFQVVLTLASIMFGVPTAMLCIVQTRNISSNITTNERFNKDKYNYLKDEEEKFANPFDKGFVWNWLEILYGNRKSLVNLYTSLPDDYAHIMGAEAVSRLDRLDGPEEPIDHEDDYLFAPRAHPSINV